MKMKRKTMITVSILVLGLMGVLGAGLFLLDWRWGAAYWGLFSLPWLAAVLSLIENIHTSRGHTEVEVDWIGD